MHDLSIEGLQTGQLRVVGLVQLTDCRDQEIRIDGIGFSNFCLFPTDPFHLRSPCIACVVPTSFFYCRIEADMPVKLVFVRYINQIILNFFLPGIFSSPLAIRLEGVGIKVTEDCAWSVEDDERVTTRIRDSKVYEMKV